MYFFQNVPPYRFTQNPYPPINISLFQQSLEVYPSLLKRGEHIINQLKSSPALIHRLMEAAQAGRDDEVDSIISEVAITRNVTTSYTPMSVAFTLSEDNGGVSPCCRLTMYVRWG